MFCIPFSLVCAALATPAEAGSLLRFDPEYPPIVVHEAGSIQLLFPGRPPIDTQSAVVVALRTGVNVPQALRDGGEPLGISERTWRVPVAHPQDLVVETARWLTYAEVETALPDIVLHHRTAEFDDPRYGGQWYLETLGFENLYAESPGSSDVRVAVIDSGIQLDHPDLAAAFDAPYDAFADDDDPSPDPGDGHGTSVAGIIGARANNGEGIVGLCPECRVIPIKLIGDGAGTLSADIRAFEHAIAQNAAVINNSWGFSDEVAVPEPLAAVIRRAATEPRDGLGAVVVFAAGNDDRELDDDELPALDEVLCVSATDRYGNPTAYTNFGGPVDLAAPSATFTTDVGGGYTELFGGTSAAAPVVSGVAAWIASVEPDLTAAEIRALIVDTAVPSPKVVPDETGHDPFYGFGELSTPNILAAVRPPEESRACGCASSATSAAGLPTWLVYFFLLLRGGSKSPNSTETSRPSVA
jgi:serine protease